MQKGTKDLLQIGGIALAGLVAWNWIAGKDGLPGLPAPGAVIGGVVSEAVEAAGSVVANIPIGIARGLGAEKIGEGLFDFITQPTETEEYFARVQWGLEEQKGIPTGGWEMPLTGWEMPITGWEWSPFTGFIQPDISHPKVVTLGPATKTFVEEAPWREDPGVLAGLAGPTIGGITYPTMIAYLEAQRAKYVQAGCID